jgi:AcrR family transcriptional regulator
MDQNTSKPPVTRSQASVAGFSGTSLDRLVERSGVSKTTMMRRFGSKLGLFQQLAHNCGASVKAQLWAVQLDPDDPTGTLTRFIQTYIDVAVLAPEGRMLLEITLAERKTVPDLSAFILENGREGLQPISSYIGSLMERGVLAPGNPLNAAFDLQALITHGFRFMVDTLNFVKESDRAAQIATRFLKGWA